MTDLFNMRGTCLSDGKTYRLQCLCNGMTADEKQEWIRESNFDPRTVIITKRKEVA